MSLDILKAKSVKEIEDNFENLSRLDQLYYLMKIFCKQYIGFCYYYLNYDKNYLKIEYWNTNVPLDPDWRNSFRRYLEGYGFFVTMTFDKPSEARTRINRQYIYKIMLDD